MFRWENSYASYINLDHRKDRLHHMIEELHRVALSAVRTPGIPVGSRQWDPFKYGVMLRRTPGAVGCHESQVSVMRKAFEMGKSAFVMEDDLIFCSDIKERLDYIQDFLNAQDDWDVFFLGGTVHTNPAWWHKPGHSTDLQMCGCHLRRDAETTSDPRILRVYGAFSTHAYIVNVKSIEKILNYFENNIHLSMGIDWLFIKMQPMLKAYMFVPGCIKQMDNQSDIGYGITKFSGFSMLGPYWWQDKKEDFDPTTYDWGEAKNNG
jgi:GR25 family glycosyltransferase involved in LPS biosynthesis